MLTKDYRVTKTHFFFWNTVFSQWFHRKDKPLFKEDGNEFWTAEHYMMYHKARVFGDTKTMEECLKAHSPGRIKAFGRDIPNFNDELWNKHKMDIVTRGNFLKFSQNKDLLDTMIKYKDLILVEASPYDKIWGIGMHFEDDAVEDEQNWQGENLLGICLMRARDQLLNIMIPEMLRELVKGNDIIPLIEKGEYRVE